MAVRFLRIDLYALCAPILFGTSFLGPRYNQRERTNIHPPLTRSLSQHDQLSTSSHRLLCPANSYPMSATLVGTPRYVFAAFTNDLSSGKLPLAAYLPSSMWCTIISPNVSSGITAVVNPWNQKLAYHSRTRPPGYQSTPYGTCLAQYDSIHGSVDGSCEQNNPSVQLPIRRLPKITKNNQK